MASEMKNHYMDQSNDSIFDILIAMKMLQSPSTYITKI